MRRFELFQLRQTFASLPRQAYLTIVAPFYYQTIVSSAEVAKHLEDPKWIIFDCRFVIPKPEAGRQQYLDSHIQGAHYADLDRDLSSAPTASSGRHPLPKAQDLANKLQHWGLNQDSQIVVYDDANSSLAVRMWWLLRWLGHRTTAVLDGGFSQWSQEGRPVRAGQEAMLEPGGFMAQANDDMWVSTETVLSSLGKADCVIIDARAPTRYSGESETVDHEKGHIPTSINRPLSQNLDENHCFLPAEKLKQVFAPLQQPLTIHSCGSGVTACHNILAMEIAGLTGSRLYVGSWSEWARSSQRPRATGMKPGRI